MPYCYEAQRSPTYGDDGSLERTFIAHQVFDAAQAEGLVAAAASFVYEDRVRGARPSITEEGHGTFKGVFKYELPPGFDQQPPPNNDPPSGILEFDTSGGSTHITTALSQTHYPASAPNVKRAIGVGLDTVEGVDIVIPKLTLSVTKHWPMSTAMGTYSKNLARLTGKVNQSDYAIDGEPYEGGELLFLGASGTSRGRPDWEITYRFEASQNATDISVSPDLTGISKKGHEYLWVRFKKEETENNLVQVPEFVYVATVYKSDNFQSVLGF